MVSYNQERMHYMGTQPLIVSVTKKADNPKSIDSRQHHVNLKI